MICIIWFMDLTMALLCYQGPKLKNMGVSNVVLGSVKDISNLKHFFRTIGKQSILPTSFTNALDVTRHSP